MSSRDALTASTKSAITTFRHPLFVFPDVPLVIVEGKFDDLYLRAALARSARRPRWKLLAPGTMTGEDIGGDGVLPYLRYNAPVLCSRPDTAPIIVVRDWEVPDSDLAKYATVLAKHPTSKPLRPDGDLSNPELNESFVGIERFLTTDRIKRVVPATVLGLENALPGARFTITSRSLKKYKPALAKSMETDPDAGPHMERLLNWIDDQIDEILAQIPPENFG